MALLRCRQVLPLGGLRVELLYFGESHVYGAGGVPALLGAWERSNGCKLDAFCIESHPTELRRFWEVTPGLSSILLKFRRVYCLDRPASTTQRRLRAAAQPLELLRSRRHRGSAKLISSDGDPTLGENPSLGGKEKSRTKYSRGDVQGRACGAGVQALEGPHDTRLNSTPFHSENGKEADVLPTEKRTGLMEGGALRPTNPALLPTMESFARLGQWRADFQRDCENCFRVLQSEREELMALRLMLACEDLRAAAVEETNTSTIPRAVSAASDQCCEGRPTKRQSGEGKSVLPLDAVLLQRRQREILPPSIDIERRLTQPRQVLRLGILCGASHIYGLASSLERLRGCNDFWLANRLTLPMLAADHQASCCEEMSCSMSRREREEQGEGRYFSADGKRNEIRDLDERTSTSAMLDVGRQLQEALFPLLKIDPIKTEWNDFHGNAFERVRELEDGGGPSLYPFLLLGHVVFASVCFYIPYQADMYLFRKKMAGMAKLETTTEPPMQSESRTEKSSTEDHAHQSIHIANKEARPHDKNVVELIS
ncbi:unnamed protein product, partial [Amoebophrya sp. A25]|eukprot:GSA25T00007541001.1